MIKIEIFHKNLYHKYENHEDDWIGRELRFFSLFMCMNDEYVTSF